MSNFVWCHGPSCHKSHTQDRIRGVKGSKVLRTRKVQQHETRSKLMDNGILTANILIILATLIFLKLVGGII